MVVNVPWSDTDTNTTYSAATSSALGLSKLVSDTAQSEAANSITTTASRTYGVQHNSSGQMVVNVPWTDTDTDTTYSNATTSAAGLMSASDKTNLDNAVLITNTNQTIEGTKEFSSTIIGSISGNAATATALETQSSGVAPTTTPSSGTMVFDTNNNKIYIYNGSNWRSIDTAAI